MWLNSEYEELYRRIEAGETFVCVIKGRLVAELCYDCGDAILIAPNRCCGTVGMEAFVAMCEKKELKWVTEPIPESL